MVGGEAALERMASRGRCGMRHYLHALAVVCCVHAEGGTTRSLAFGNAGAWPAPVRGRAQGPWNAVTARLSQVARPQVMKPIRVTCQPLKMC